MALRVIAPAKVNLFLGVGGVRADGYHDVTTVLHTLELADILTLSPSEKPSLTCDVDLGVAPERNLAYRALLGVADALGREPLVAIAIEKRIPHGAGLGGGSSDAAAVIVGLCELWGCDPLDPKCIAVAASLGADVPFFLQPGGAALMTGRGDRIARTLPALAGVPAVVVKPPAPVPTAQAYAAFDAAPVAPGSAEGVVAALEAGDLSATLDRLENNLEAAAGTVVPEVADALAWTREAAGVSAAIVAGSGSSVVGLCESVDAAAEVAAHADAHGWLGIPTALAGHGARLMEGAT